MTFVGKVLCFQSFDKGLPGRSISGCVCVLGPLQAAFVTSPDLSQLESLSAEQRLELIKTNRDVLLAWLALGIIS